MALFWVLRVREENPESSPGDQIPQARHKWLPVTQMQGL